jgi:hypothetical protein
MQPHGPLIGSTEKGPFTSDETYWKAYTETLEYVFPYAKSVADEVVGKAVITADHGQINYGGLLKHLGLKSHAPNLRLPGLVEVPWAEIDGERREIVAGDTRTAVQDNVEDRLKDLGYKV